MKNPLFHIKNPFILVDGSSYLFRAYHALPPLTNSKGQPTGAIYGVLNMLRRLLKDYEPTHMAVIFDSKEPTFRKELYPAYKAHRLVMPDELQLQLQPLYQTIKALGLPLIIIPGVEADDIIATLAIQAPQLGMHTLISTGDKDLAQIVDKNVTLINTMNNTLLDVAGVKQKFGVSPSQIIDYLALVGDNVDNIAGVPGVGPKTAAKWLNEYQTLDNLITHAGEISGKVGESLRLHLSELPLAKQLVSVKLDIPLTVTPKDLMVSLSSQNELIELFTNLEFKNWLNEIKSETKLSPPLSSRETTQVTILNDKESLTAWLAKLASASHISIETLITGGSPLNAEASLIGIALAINESEAAYIPLAHKNLNGILQLDKAWILSKLQPIFSNENKFLIGHNLKLILQILIKEGLKIKTKLWDSMLAAYVLDSSASRYDLSSIVLRYLQQNSTTSEELLGKGSKQISFDQIAFDKASHFAAENAHLAFKLFSNLQKKISTKPELQKVLHEIDFSLLPVLTRMELHGVLINVEMLTKQSQDLEVTCEKIQNQVHHLAGEVFNLSSPKQLQTILFEKLKLPISKKTPKGQASTAEEVLQELARTYEIAQLLLTHRNLTKLKTTYIDKLPHQINSQTYRVHTCYQQTGTVTGRLSSKDPNLQNIPIRSDEGRKIRQAFIAPTGYKIISADYSQVELRIMAHLSQDPSLLSAFAAEQDIHQSTAAEVFGVSLDHVTPNQRRSAKAINFGLIYGMSSFGLAQQLSISRQQAQEYIDIYFQRYPLVYQYINQARQLATEQGYVTTLCGRCISVADIKSNNLQRRLAAERAAINAPLQGTAADIIKLAMIEIDKQFNQNHLPAFMIMQVHDELVFEVKESVKDEVKNIIKSCMENVLDLSVPLVVDIGIGNNWDEAH